METGSGTADGVAVEDPVMRAALRAAEVCASGGATREFSERAIYRAARSARVASTPQGPWSQADEDVVVAAMVAALGARE